MEINYLILVPVVVFAILLIVWMISRNIKDEEKFKQDTIHSEIDREKHDED